MKRLRRAFLVCAVSFLFAAPAMAHDLPLSCVDLRLTSDGINVTVEDSAKNFARELGNIDEATLLDGAQVKQLEARPLGTIAAGLTIRAAGETLQPELRALEPLPARKDLRLRLQYTGKITGDAIQIRCGLFSGDPAPQDLSKYLPRRKPEVSGHLRQRHRADRL